MRIHFRDRIWPRTDVAGLEAEKKKREKEIAKGGGTLDKGARENETLPQGGRVDLGEERKAGTRGNGRVKRAAARRNSSLALIALGGLLSIMSGNRWLTQFPAARFVWPA